MTTKLRIAGLGRLHSILAWGFLIASSITGSILAPAVFANRAQSASQAPQAAAATIPSLTGLRPGTKIEARLQTTLDVLATKVGDQVVGRVTNNLKRGGQIIVHEGDLLVGQVTSVQPQSVARGEEDSEVGIVFDRLRSGETSYRLNSVIHSVSWMPGQRRIQGEASEEAQPEFGRSVGRRGSGGASGISSGRGTYGTGGHANRGLGSVGEEIPRPGTYPSKEPPPPESIKVRTRPGAEGQPSKVSVLTARKGNLRLGAGTRLQFRIQGQ